MVPSTLLPLLLVALRAAGAALSDADPIAGEADVVSEIDFDAEGVQWAFGAVGGAPGHHGSGQVDGGPPSWPPPPEHPRPPHPPPHHPPHPPKTDKTIYEALSSAPEYSILLKLVNLNNATIDLLNQTETNITFFAPPNSAFPKHHEKPHKPHEFSEDFEEDLDSMERLDPSEVHLTELLSAVEKLDDPSNVAEDDDDEKKKRWRRIIKYIARAVVTYHVIPKPLPPPELAVNTTYATNLTIGHGFLDNEPARVRIQPQLFPPGVFSVNFFAHTVGHGLHAANGIAYKVSLPLLPPPSIFQELFLAPSPFSIATSAFQRVGLTPALERVYKHGSKGKHGTLKGAGAVTVFVPTNRAFERLPPKLRFFLFSPFGERVLSKLLRYHIVPGVILHSDYFHNATDSATAVASADGYEPLPERPTMALSNVEEDMYSYHGYDLGVSHSFVPSRPPPPPPRLVVDDNGAASFSSRVVQEGADPTEPQGSSAFSHTTAFAEFAEKRHDELKDTPRSGEGSSARFTIFERPGEPPMPDEEGDILLGVEQVGKRIAKTVLRKFPPLAVPPQPPRHCKRPPGARPPVSVPVYERKFTLPTLLDDAALNVTVTKHRVPAHRGVPAAYVTHVFAGGVVAFPADVVANNGALHVVGRVLNPLRGKTPPHPPPREHRDEASEAAWVVIRDDVEEEWEGWEDWLIRWADKA